MSLILKHTETLRRLYNAKNGGMYAYKHII